MSELPLNEEISLISRGLHKELCDEIGYECTIRRRRQKFDLTDALQNCTIRACSSIISGSMAEGFSFESSDLDVMMIPNKSVVLPNVMLSVTCPKNNQMLFVMETDGVPPGFSLLRCLKFENNSLLFRSLITKGDRIYLNSKTVRETRFMDTESTLHGPCQMSKIFGTEMDLAITMKCPYWPASATSFIHRSLRRGWPDFDVMKDICKDGCLFVPVNSRKQRCSDTIDLEWRISFSRAEKKLIYLMNHCQFLCYGLSKIFLKEVMTKMYNNDLLCSYFMKTALFWEISEDRTDWTPRNFLSKFWNVLRRIMKWVKYGYCPNFFIPENNMFAGKIEGAEQTRLLEILGSVHRDGYWCLLQCQTLKKPLMYIIQMPEVVYRLPIHHDEGHLHSPFLDAPALDLICRFDSCTYSTGISLLFRELKNTTSLTISNELMLYAVRLRANFILQKVAQIFITDEQICVPNRTQYKIVTTSRSILRKTKTFFCMNHIIHAKCLYMRGNYRGTIDMVRYVKSQLQGQPFMYKWNLDENIIMTKRGMPYDAVVKSTVVSYVELKYIETIEELKTEFVSKFEKFPCGVCTTLRIPTLVFLNLLLILSYTRRNEIQPRNEALLELQALVFYDTGKHIRNYEKAISLEILGLCQQLCGDHQNAYQSYVNALNIEFNYFKSATVARIRSLDMFNH